MRCKATSKRSGSRCKNTAVEGREVCYMHGGRSLSGIAHPGFKHGRRSKYLRALPAKLRKGIEEMREGNPNYLSLREEIELVDAEILGGLDALYGDDQWTTSWKWAKQALRKFYAASRANQRDLAAAALDELSEAIEGGYRLETAMWRLQKFIDLRRKLASTEGRNLERATKALTAAEVVALVHQFNMATKELVDGIVAAIATEHELDPEALRKLTRRPLGDWVEEVRKRATPATDPLPPSPADQPPDLNVN